VAAGCSRGAEPEGHAVREGQYPLAWKRDGLYCFSDAGFHPEPDPANAGRVRVLPVFPADAGGGC
jgi:hypothetical protein